MKTYTHPSMISKGIALSLAALMALSVAIPQPAAAQTTNANLQAQIASLLAQIASLQAQLGVSKSSQCPYTWNRDLTTGASGNDVKKLQQFLNSDPGTQVAFSGVGSPGFETEYFGPATGAAVAKFQNKYRSEILTPNGLLSPTTYFGPATRAKINSLCLTAPAVSTPATPTTPVVTNPTTSTTPNLKAGAELERFKISSGDDTNLQEAQKDAPIVDVEFTVRDGDIMINRIEVAFEHISGEEEDAWKTFSEISLWSDNDKIAKKSVSSKNDWLQNSPFNGADTVRFSGLNIRVDEDETFEFTVGVTLQRHVDGASSGLSWDIFVPNRGIRVLDADNVADFIGDETDKVNIDINEQGSEDELAIRSAKDDPEATTLRVERNKTSDWMTVFAFDLDTEDSENDIEIRSLPVSLTVSTGTVNTFVDDVRVRINGKTYRDVTMTDGIASYITFKFRSNEFVIDAGDRETVEVQAKFRSFSDEYEGVTIEGSASSTEIRAEGADDLRDSQISGAATGDLHQLRTVGAEVKNQNTSSARLITNNTSDLTDDEGSFKINFSITAFESDLYINRSAIRGSSLGTAGANYVIVDTSGDVTTDGTVAASLISDARTSGSQFIVREGETRTFTLTVNFDPDTTGFYAMRLYSFNYATNTGNPTAQQKALPIERYQTDPLSI